MKQDLSDDWRNNPQSTYQAIDDTKVTVHTFMDQIEQAKINGDEWVETTKEIIHHYNRKGLNGAKYFVYNGVKVCERGKLDEIINEMNMQEGHKVFGPTEGIVNG